jgi:tryptophan 2,3-dioxygenase
MPMAKPYPPVSYVDYLKTGALLSLQTKRSEQFGPASHDELLFIIAHQSYELWFKQILAELDSVLSIFGQVNIDETDMSTAVARLQRVVEIEKLLVSQVSILETMTPLDFLEFREFLFPASGFQSVQFRLIENKLGLRVEGRLPFNSLPYHAFVSESEREELIASEKKASLFDLVDQWLARTPFLQIPNFDFWKEYQVAVEAIFAGDRETVATHPLLNEEEKKKNFNEISANEATFHALFNENEYLELVKNGSYRLSYRALHASLLIHLYRDQPVLSLPFQIITALQDIDELMTTWRYRHSLMAHRMLGRKVGTGGSSGSQYLKQATDKHRVFTDFFNLATFLIPRSRRPQLPALVQQQLGFYYSAGSTPPSKGSV